MRGSRHLFVAAVTVTLIGGAVAPAHAETPAGGAAEASRATPPETPRILIEAPAARIGERAGAPLYRKQILSPVHEIDRVYTSMKGPLAQHRFRLGDGEEGELLWMVGFEAVMVGADGRERLSQEFMCHSNLNVGQPTPWFHAFQTKFIPSGGRLFSLAQGQLRVELPEGFGVPFLADHVVWLVAQALNHNLRGEAIEVRHLISIDFVRDRELTAPLVPLLPRAVYGMKLLEGPDGYFALDPAEADPDLHGASCLVGSDAGGVAPHAVSDSHGRRFTGFWQLPPGREVNETLVTGLLALPSDTRVHYISAHLHPFAESLELRDLTTGETVYRAGTSQAERGIGLARVDHYSSTEGLALSADHEYQLVSVYDNTSEAEQDAMATLFLYVRATDLDLARYRTSAASADATP